MAWVSGLAGLHNLLASQLVADRHVSMTTVVAINGPIWMPTFWLRRWRTRRTLLRELKRRDIMFTIVEKNRHSMTLLITGTVAELHLLVDRLMVRQ